MTDGAPWRPMFAVGVFAGLRPARFAPCSTAVTLRYGHLVRGQFTEQERALVDVQLGEAKVLPLRPRGRAL